MATDYSPRIARSAAVATRRELLQQGLATTGLLATGSMLSGCNLFDDSGSGGTPGMVSNIANIGPLSTTADANGFLLPDGFSSRQVAKTGLEPVATSSYVWHDLPDGGATYPTPSGGWIYVSNSEVNNGAGGVGALEFDRDGNVIEAFSLLTGTTMNCAGGPTPWSTWLSCEEFSEGAVWECFPLERGQRAAVQRPAMGVFQHEAAAIDPATGIVYMTEDRPDGCLYRFIPDVRDDLSSGLLEVAVADTVDAEQIAQEGFLSWVAVPDPAASTQSTREQARQLGAGIFVRGEGAWFHDGVLYISTTVDAAGGGIVWSYTPTSGALTQIYNRTSLFPQDTSLNGVDNITVSSGGDVLVAEDSDDMQIQALTPGGLLVPLFSLTGHQVFIFPGEITGPAFDPSGTRLYFSSQRGTQDDFVTQGRLIGVTFEISGPFMVPAG